MKKGFASIVCFIVLTEFIFGQNINGLPFIKNYSAKEINAAPDNWAAAQDERGVMYFANSQGLLEYDGVSWELYMCDNFSVIRSIAIAPNKIIYAGAVADFGFYKPNKNGLLSYNSLLQKVPKQYRNFTDVWKTYAVANKIIFVTNAYIFVYENDKIEVLKPEGTFHFGYLDDGHFYILDRGFGLKKYEEGKLKLLPNGGFFKDDKLYSLFSDNGKLIAGTRRGIFEYDPKSGKANPIKNNVLNKFVVENEIYNGIKLKNGNYCFGTLLGGYALLNKNGKMQVVDELSGLQDRCVKYMFEDRSKNLWLCLDNGISLSKSSSQLSLFNKKNGLPDGIVSVCNNQKYIYCNTRRDVYCAPVNNTNEFSQNEIYFKKIATPASVSLELRKFFVDKQEHILLTTFDGIFEIKGEAIVQISDLPSLSITQTKHSDNLFWVASKFGIAQLEFKNNSWNLNELSTNLDDAEVLNIVETNDSKIIISTSSEGVFKGDFNFDKKEFTQLNKCTKSEINLPDLTYPFFYKEQLFLSKIIGLLKYDKGNFVNALEFSNLATTGQFKPAISDTQGNLYVSYNDSDGIKKIKLFKISDGKFIDTKTELSAFENLVVNNFYVDENNLLWIASAEGLFVYDNKIEFNSNNFNSLVRRIKAGDKTIFQGTFLDGNNVSHLQPTSNVAELEYANNSIKFEFAAPLFFNENNIKYSIYLEGLEEGFGDFANQHTQSYSKLHEGNYIFHVKALNSYGVESAEFTYVFTVKPPWYRTGVAYFIYIIITILIVYLIVLLSTKRLKNAKIVLEKIVTERTKEIVLEKENVEQQKKIVEQKNQDITDSINYAQRIQQAILPLDDDIKNQIADSFILFKPRDIVSGDFYWFSKISDDEFLIACVDCTGHGVPGAFMSMIGNTLLNEIVNQKNIYEPAYILNELHLGVRLSLKQNQENTQSRDGMDIAVMKLNTATKTLEYAAANRPLFIVENSNEVIEIKANKFAIGGIQGDDERKFTNHTIQLKPGTAFYATTDGFADQFGGEFGKKFMVKKFKEMLLENFDKPMNEQKNIYDNIITKWMEHHEQIDDILLMGFKV